jgi:hypothetical protein
MKRCIVLALAVLLAGCGGIVEADDDTPTEFFDGADNGAEPMPMPTPTSVPTPTPTPMPMPMPTTSAPTTSRPTTRRT